MVPSGRSASPALLLLAGALVLFAAGCATTSDATGGSRGADVIAGVDGGTPESLSPSDRAFIEESLTIVVARESSSPGAGQPGHDEPLADSRRNLPGPAPASPEEPGITPGGEGFGVERIVGFVSFSQWDEGRELLRRAGILDDAGVQRLRRAVVAARGRSAVLFLDVDSRRFPVAWSLVRSPWKRQGRGVWRDPATGATLELRRNESWIYSSGDVVAGSSDRPGTDPGSLTGGVADPPPAGAVSPSESDPSPILDGAAWSTVDLIHTHAVADDRDWSIAAVFWFQGLALDGLPPGLLPATVTLAILDAPSPGAGGSSTPAPEDAGGGNPAADDDPLLSAIALPFRDERTARTASVAVRLLLPSFLDGTGVEIDARSGIVRENEVLILKDVSIGRSLVDAIVRRLAP